MSNFSMALQNVKLISYSYSVTTTFTLLAVLNLTSWWGKLSLSYGNGINEHSCWCEYGIFS